MGSVVSALLLIAIRFLLARENRQRDDASGQSTRRDVYLADGKEGEKRIDDAFLDLTDQQNRDFRYVL
jgi:ACS family allantoate permease-like MFS transporter